MLRAIVWKEFREQGIIGLTLVVFGTGILVAAATLADPPSQGASPADVIRFLGAGLLATMMLSVTAGTVCGGALFAAEREAGTLGFLESLPVSRWRVWRAKVFAGFLLAILQIGLVLFIAFTLGFITTPGWAFAIAVFALMAFVWGAYGSTHAQTTLGSVGVAVSSGAGAFLLFYIPLWILFPDRTSMLRADGALILVGLMLVTPLLGSALRFTRLDRERTEDAPAHIPSPTAGGREERVQERDPFLIVRPRLGLTALLWLSVRQLLKPGFGIAAFGVVLGLSLLPETVHPVLLWPGMALSAGVLAGVTVFMDEQSGGSARFWGERRLPVGRLWLMKLLVHGAFAVFLAVLLLLPTAIRAQTEGGQMMRGGTFFTFTFRSLLFDNLHFGRQGLNFVLLPLVYGFAAGHLCGMLFKKAVVAAGVAGIVGGSVAAFWLPSLLAGAVHAWQLWLPPALALLTARLLLRAWASERLPTRRPLLVLAGGLASILLAVAAGLGWRVWEVPDEEGAEDDEAYVASLPPLEAVDAARQFRTSAERFARAAQAVPTPSPRGSTQPALEDRINNVIVLGWPAKAKGDDGKEHEQDPDIADWLDKVFERVPGDTEEPWFAQAAGAGRDPSGGTFEHPLRTGTTASLITQANGRRMGMILLARGLQKQAGGDHGAFIENLRTTLALSRAFRNGSITNSLEHGNYLVRAACSATDRWLAVHTGPPDQIRAAIRLLEEDVPAAAFDPRPHLLAERYVLRDLAKAPAQFLPAQLTPPGRDREQYSAIVDLIAVAWNTPWERERTRRLLGLGYERGESDPGIRALVRGRPGSSIFLTRKQTPGDMSDTDRLIRLHRSALLLVLAVRLHHRETGAPPAALEDLVRGARLARLPLDPFSGESFHYRLSAGEALAPPPAPQGLVPLGKGMPGPEPRSLAAGQPVIWSVGMNGTDDGGLTLPSVPGRARSGPDFVYLPPIGP